MMWGVILGEGEVASILFKKFVTSLDKEDKFVLFSFGDEEKKEELYSYFKKEGISLAKMLSHFHISYLSFSDLLARLHQERIRNLLIGGKFDKLAAFNIPSPRKDTYSLANFFFSSLSKLGIEVKDQLNYLKEYLFPHGILTKAVPKGEDYQDIQYGLKIAKEIAKLGISEAITIKRGLVLCIEGAEGTDRLIQHTGELTQDFILVKVAPERLDTRWEVPAVGKNTVLNLAKFKARILAAEADKVLFINKDEAIKIADDNGIVIIGV